MSSEQDHNLLVILREGPGGTFLSVLDIGNPPSIRHGNDEMSKNGEFDCRNRNPFNEAKEVAVDSD